MACGCSGCSNGSPCEAVKLPKGKKGDAGPPGAAATIAVGTVTTLAPGEDATVDNSGSSSAAVFDFGIPAGAVGQGAYTTISTGWTVPPVGNESASLTVLNNEWMAVGEPVWVEGAGTFEVASLTGSTTITLTNLTATPGSLVGFNTMVTAGGQQGDQGPTGPGAFTFTSANYTQPAVAGTVTISVVDGSWAGLGQPVYIEAGGIYIVTATGTTTLQVQNTGATGNGSPGATIFSPAKVSPGGRQGVAGNNGNDGAAGHTPVTTSGTANPNNADGDDGDVYMQKVNGGKIQWYTKSGGFWSALVTGVAIWNRLLGSGSADPNGLGLIANINDQYHTQISTTLTIWIYTGLNWVPSLTWTSGGGGGSSDLPTAASLSANISGIGQDMGALTWALRRIIAVSPLSATHTTPGGTYQVNMQYAETNLSVQANVVLNIDSSYTANAERRLRMNNPTAGALTITYSSNVWQVNQGVSYPTSITAGETITIIFEMHTSRPTITNVIANVSLIP